MGTTWSARKPPPPTPGLLDRGAEKWAAMRANPVKADPTLGPIYQSVTQPDGSAIPNPPKPKPTKQRYF